MSRTPLGPRRAQAREAARAERAALDSRRDRTGHLGAPAWNRRSVSTCLKLWLIKKSYSFPFCLFQPPAVKEFTK